MEEKTWRQGDATVTVRGNLAERANEIAAGRARLATKEDWLDAIAEAYPNYTPAEREDFFSLLEREAVPPPLAAKPGPEH